MTAYERGQEMGKIEARLSNHDQHFAHINGSIDKLVEGITQLNVVIAANLAEARGAREREKSVRAHIVTAAAVLGVALTAVVVIVNILTA